MERKILIIDDEKPTLNMFRLFLTALGYGVLTAENGEAGIQKFKEESPPVVLTDVKMPGISGMDVLEQIKKISPETEVIVITGHGDMELAIKALNLDATDFINKPVQRQSLNQALKRAEDRIARRKSPPDSIKVEAEGDLAVIRVGVELNIDTQGMLADAFHKAVGLSDTGLILSFKESATVHGPALDSLKTLLRETAARGVRTALAGVPDTFRQVFISTGIAEIAEIHTTLDQALKALKTG